MLLPGDARIYDVAIVGGGVAGMATASRLQARGLSTIVYEAHCQPGGCAGYYRRKGFSFDVGATTLVDFGADGVGGELLDSIGMMLMEADALPGYIAWLPDRFATLYRDWELWSAERLRVFGDTPAHRGFWELLDRLAAAFWAASRRGIKLPLQSVTDLTRIVSVIGLKNLPLVRYLRQTMGDSLRSFGLRNDAPLVGLLSMLIEDTVNSTIDDAPLINAALGISIRGAGLTRVRGGMRGFWRQFIAHYRAMGGELRLGCPVEKIEGRAGNFRLTTKRGITMAAQVVSAVPTALTSIIAPPSVARTLAPYLSRDSHALGSAVIICLGVPEEELAGQAFTHHQLMHDYSSPLGSGNNMFISVSAPGDTKSAPPGYNAVMISTHCDLESWEGLTPDDYETQKRSMGDRLVNLARCVYSGLGANAVVCEIGTPRTYERFTRRPRGAVGGVRQTLANSNQHAVPHDIGVPGFYLVGDTTWPGLGTVACVLGSRIVAEMVYGSTSDRFSQRTHPPPTPPSLIEPGKGGIVTM